MGKPPLKTSPSATLLWSVARTQLMSLFGALDDGEVILRGRTLLGLSGGPTADFNMCLADDSPHLAEALVAAIERLKARALPGVFMLSTSASEAIADRIDSLGLRVVGEAPLMVFTGNVPEVDPRYEVVDVTDSPGLREVAGMVATAFDLDAGWVARTFASPALINPSKSVAFYMARTAGTLMSTVTVTHGGPIAGIWSMATPLDRRRRGAGRAALLGAMARHRDGGAEAFYLIATPSGKPLYDSVGFTTVETFPLLVPGN